MWKQDLEQSLLGDRQRAVEPTPRSTRGTYRPPGNPFDDIDDDTSNPQATTPSPQRNPFERAPSTVQAYDPNRSKRIKYAVLLAVSLVAGAAAIGLGAGAGDRGQIWAYLLGGGSVLGTALSSWKLYYMNREEAGRECTSFFTSRWRGLWRRDNTPAPAARKNDLEMSLLNQ